MTYSPQTYLEIRYLFQRKTGLPAVSLGIQHYSVDDADGGYHDGIDLLKAIGRYLGSSNPAYSVRESTRDQPGTDGASAIDIGWFDVVLPNGRRVTLITLNRWMEANWNAPDAQWLREWIYSVDGVNVKRLDRLGIRTSGDGSHTSHAHGSGFRDEEATNKVALFERFWREQEGISFVLLDGDNNDRQLLFRLGAITSMEDVVHAPAGIRLAIPDEENKFVKAIKRIEAKADQQLAKWAGEETRDAATTTVLNAMMELLRTGDGDVDVTAIITEIRRAEQTTNAIVSALQDELGETNAKLNTANAEIADLRAQLARASQASANFLDTDPNTN